MKKYIVLSVSLVVAGAQAGVVLSNPASAPTENIALSQLDSSGAAIVQARNLASDMSQWRAITQTFYWTTDDAFDGIGLHMGAGNDALWTSGKSQTHQLVIQTLNANVPTQTVLNVEFLLSDDKVADGQWLYIDTDNVNLINGQLYGLSLAPVETAVNGGLRTYWNTASANAHAGIARQYAPNATTLYVPKEDTYATGGGVNDYTLYMQSIPEPGTIGLVGLCSAGLLFIRRVFMV